MRPIYRFDNLEVVKACRHKPHLKGSSASSLVIAKPPTGNYSG